MKIILTIVSILAGVFGATAQEISRETPVIGTLGGTGEGARECRFALRQKTAGKVALSARSLGLDLRIDIATDLGAIPDAPCMETAAGIGQIVFTILEDTTYRVRVAADSGQPFLFGLRLSAADDASARPLPSNFARKWRRARDHLAEDCDSEPTASSLMALYVEASGPELALEAALAAREGLAWTIRNRGVSSPEAVAFNFRCAESSARLGHDQDEERRYQDGITAGAAAGEAAAINVAALESNYGRFCFRRQRPAEAREHFARALALRETALGPDYALRDIDLNNLGAALADESRGHEALPLLEEALHLREIRVGRESMETAIVLGHLARAERAVNRVENAVRYARETLGIRRKIEGSRALPTVKAMEFLLCYLIDSGRFAEARPLVEEALAIVTELEGKESGRRAHLLFDLGTIALAFEEWTIARNVLEECIPVLGRTLGRGSEPSIGARADLAIVWGKLGDLPRARKEFETLVLEMRADSNPPRAMLSGCLNGLAWAAVSMGDVNAARDAILDRLRVSETDPSESGYRRLVAIGNLARIEELSGNPARAFAAVERTMKSARTLLDQQMPVLSESERLRAAASHRWTLDRMLVLGPMLTEPPPPDRLYAAVLGWKGQVSRGLLAQRAWLASHRDGASASRLAAVQEASVAASRMEIEREVFERDAFSARAQAPDPTIIRGALADGDVLVDFLVSMSDGGRPGAAGLAATRPVYAFIVRKDRPIAIVPLGELAKMAEAIDAHLLATRRRTRAGAADPEKWSASALELIWKPLLPHVEGSSRIVICPDGILAGLPFETLPGTKAGTFLIEEYEFSYVQSATDLIEPASAVRGAGGALLVGAVDYGAPLPGVRVARWKPLDFGALEIEAIARTFEASARRPPAVLRGSEATAKNIARLVPGVRYLHLATHGVFGDLLQRSETGGVLASAVARAGGFDDGTPGRSDVSLALADAALVLAGANALDPRQAGGLLTADAAAWLDLAECELVVLSACDTGLVHTDVAEELLGLRRAFRLAGARATLSSLWKIDDESTRAMLEAFYDRLWRSGDSPRSALRQTQLDRLAQNRAATGDGLPGTWGAFLIDGKSR